MAYKLNLVHLVHTAFSVMLFTVFVSQCVVPIVFLAAGLRLYSLYTVWCSASQNAARGELHSANKHNRTSCGYIHWRIYVPIKMHQSAPQRKIFSRAAVLSDAFAQHVAFNGFAVWCKWGLTQPRERSLKAGRWPVAAWRKSSNPLGRWRQVFRFIQHLGIFSAGLMSLFPILYILGCVHLSNCQARIRELCLFCPL